MWLVCGAMHSNVAEAQARWRRSYARDLGLRAAGVVLAAGLVAFSVWRSALERVVRDEAGAQASLMALGGATAMLEEGPAAACARVARWSQLPGVSVLLLDPRGGRRCGASALEPEVSAAARGRGQHTRVGPDGAVAVASAGALGHLGVRVAVSGGASQTGPSLLALAALGALAFAAWSLAPRRVLRTVGDDLDALISATEAMVAGRPSGRLSPQRDDEVGALVESFGVLQARFEAEAREHREALEKLEEVERRRGATVTTLRHELRTPLNSIVGFAELLLAGGDGPLTEAQREDVTVIASAGRHLLGLVDDVLDLSAMAAGRYPLARAVVDLAALTREVLREAQGVARLREVTLSLEAPDELRLEADGAALRRALTNLVLNAIEHGGRAVTVTLKPLATGCSLAVSDLGRGLSQDELRRLFKPFERGKTAEARGAGLGLAITLGLVELHRGTLSAHSEVGVGSTFTITLPRSP